jgi:polyphosphate kinase 2 (PPK2 family)
VLQTTETGRDVDEQEYERRVSEIRLGLVRTQQELRGADFPVLVFLAGDDDTAIVDTMRTLNEWADPRSFRIVAFDRPTNEERAYPPLWRYWRALPPKGSIGLFLGGWAMNAIVERRQGRHKRRAFERELERVRRLEQMLVRDGALIVKFWLHLPDADAKQGRDRERVKRVVRDALEATASTEAPWNVLDSEGKRTRRLEVAHVLLEQLEERLAGFSWGESPAPPAGAATVFERPDSTVLDGVDLERELPQEDYARRLRKQQRKLHKLSHEAQERGVSTVVVFEGWDAAGKGGMIRRLSVGLDPPAYCVVPVAAPTDEERAHHYLWRFWRQLPRAGHVTIFDRSWYGRVLVERVEGFARRDEWQRAYEEIVDFEEALTAAGIVLVKFWLHIDHDEQLRRFKARETTPHKRHRVTPEDYRNRARWDEYVVAVHDMIERTSLETAPWEIVPAHDKRWARVHVVKSVCKRLRDAL